jgi:hypothetical protein
MDLTDGCTLPTEQRPLRRAEFDDLFTTLVRAERVAPGHLRLFLNADPETVRDLTNRETECCSFFHFTVSPRSRGVVLDIEVPPVRVGVLDAIADRLPAGSHD